MLCSDCIANGNCAYNIMLPYIKGSANFGEDNPNGKMVNIDKCLLPEILSIWESGIKTTGCCCGHGCVPAFIEVKEEDISKMEWIGYQHETKLHSKDRKDAFVPKTKLVYGIANKGFNWWDEV